MTDSTVAALRKLRAQLGDREPEAYALLGYALVLVVAFLGVLVWLATWAASSMGELNIMPAIWALAGILAAFIVAAWATGLRTPVVLPLALVGEAPQRLRDSLMADLWHTARYGARWWPAAIALPAFVASMGVVNIYLYGPGTSPQTGFQGSELMASMAVLTVINSLAIVTVAAVALNPMPRVVEWARRGGERTAAAAAGEEAG